MKMIIIINGEVNLYAVSVRVIIITLYLLLPGIFKSTCPFRNLEINQQLVKIEKELSVKFAFQI